MTVVTRRRMVERKIIELLMNGTGVNAIGRTLHVAKRRIRALRERAKEYGYLEADGRRGTMPLPPYPEAIFPDPVDGRSLRVSEAHQLLAPKKDWIKERLQTGWHAVTVFEELPEELKPLVSRSSFYRFLERHKLNRRGESYRVVPEIRHKPGEALILDWGRLRDVIDPLTGGKKRLWMFIGVMGFSRFMMIRLVWTMDTVTTLQTLEGMFRAMGGVPFKVTIDNPKCFALEASRYEPLLNPAVERFAAHYGVVIECLPPEDPEKKGKVERQVPYGRRLYEAHGDAWLGVEESQAYLDNKLAIANDRRHGTTLRRPREVFVQEEAKALKPLPALGYEIERFAEATVRQDGHVRLDNQYYSLDETYKGKEVVILGSAQQVSIYYQGQLLEVHARITDPNQSKSTKPQHLKPWERAMQDDSFYRKRAQALGPHVDEMVLKLLAQGQGFIDTRKVWGILSLDKSYRPDQIDVACRKALELGTLGFRAVKGFLEQEAALDEWRQRRQAPGNEVAAAPAPRTYKHVRPLSVYREQLKLFTEEGHA
jgi:transposase